MKSTKILIYSILLFVGLITGPGYAVYCKYLSGKSIGMYNVYTSGKTIKSKTISLELSPAMNTIQVKAIADYPTPSSNMSSSTYKFALSHNKKILWTRDVQFEYRKKTTKISSKNRSRRKNNMFYSKNKINLAAFMGESGTGKTINLKDFSITEAGSYTLEFTMPKYKNNQFGITEIDIQVVRNVVILNPYILVAGIILFLAGIIGFITGLTKKFMMEHSEAEVAE